MSIYISTLRKKMADKFGIILEYRQVFFVPFFWWQQKKGRIQVIEF